MKIHIATLFPDIIKNMLLFSMSKRAFDKELFSFFLYNYRDYTKDKHKRVDDTCFGGGRGMLMKLEPVENTLKEIQKNEKTFVIYPSPRGKKFEQKDAIELSKKSSITFLCGHYEGFDQRIIDRYVDIEYSIGDFVLSGGELAALCMIDATTRLLGVLDKEATDNESFSKFLLEHNQYTKPRDKDVPEVLFSGNHKEINKFRRSQSIEITKKRRKDLYLKYLWYRGLTEQKPE